MAARWLYVKDTTFLLLDEHRKTYYTLRQTPQSLWQLLWENMVSIMETCKLTFGATLLFLSCFQR